MNRHSFCALLLTATILAACSPEVENVDAPPVAVHEAPIHKTDILAPREP